MACPETAKRGTMTIPSTLRAELLTIIDRPFALLDRLDGEPDLKDGRVNSIAHGATFQSSSACSLGGMKSVEPSFRALAMWKKHWRGAIASYLGARTATKTWLGCCPAHCCAAPRAPA